MNLLWGTILNKTKGNPIFINSTHVTKIWKELCMDKRYNDICHFEDDIMAKIDETLKNYSKRMKLKQMKKVSENELKDRTTTRHENNKTNIKKKDKSISSAIFNKENTIDTQFTMMKSNNRNEKNTLIIQNCNTINSNTYTVQNNNKYVCHSLITKNNNGIVVNNKNNINKNNGNDHNSYSVIITNNENFNHNTTNIINTTSNNNNKMYVNMNNMNNNIGLNNYNIINNNTIPPKKKFSNNS
ncbi:hypothetical protein PIROE2DRAFT_3464 [Piromyces sp. E2]|nr:hypothetical protein PIROE2DRAFT_3464 [Piromyces sp. E2]|eukprot:OUM68773.1 hypothetical protein PIROE2DRAFT_3464 [Piromyces sp. E2]